MTKNVIGWWTHDVGMESPIVRSCDLIANDMKD